LGWRGYASLVELLSHGVSPREAEAAQVLFLAGLKRLGGVVAVILALAVAVLVLAGRDQFAEALMSAELAESVAVVGALVLGSVFHVRFAGRLLCTLSSLLCIFDMPMWTPDLLFDAGGLRDLGMCAVIFLVGWGIDEGTRRIQMPDAGFGRWPAWPLVVSGLFNFTGGVLFYRAGLLGSSFPWFSSAAWLGCAVWWWIPGRRMRRRAKGLNCDVQILLRVVSVRMGKLLTGWVLAVLRCLLPLILFLGSVDINRPDHGDELVSRARDGGSVRWLRTDRGQFLRRSDLSDPSQRFYFVDTSKVTEEEFWMFMNPVYEQIAAVRNNATNRFAFAELQNTLVFNRR
jgi:hypothetical protein